MQFGDIPRALVLAPHPDDEVLGPGGTVAKLADGGTDVSVLIVTKGMPPEFDSSTVETVRTEARAAQALLGVKSTLFLDFPAADLDTIPHRDTNRAFADIFESLRPDLLLIPFNGDLHRDHQRTFLSAMVAARPSPPGSPRLIWAYETLSETNWNAPLLTPTFAPQVFVDISGYLDRKLAAIRAYSSQIRSAPHERSCGAVSALAVLRGATIGVDAAEAFVVIRQLLT